MVANPKRQTQDPHPGNYELMLEISFGNSTLDLGKLCMYALRTEAGGSQSLKLQDLGDKLQP